jgi:hypothetical protein
MKISKLPLLAAILPLAATLFLVPARVHADTYQLLDLGNDNGFNIIDIDTSGVVIIFDVFTSDYLTINHGVLVNTTSTLPSLTYDNGTPCSVPSGFLAAQASKVICNNGRTGFGSRFNPNGDTGGIYTGPISSLSFFDPAGSTDLAVLNSSGDFAWSDGVHEENFEAIDLTTPEPGSLLLVGTGCLSLFGVLRRKLS